VHKFQRRSNRKGKIATLTALQQNFEMNQSATRADTSWRKSLLAARLLLRRVAGGFQPRDRHWRANWPPIPKSLTA
jgi:hypothetical protein